MKMLKVDDDLHASVMAESGSASEVLRRWRSGRTDLDVVLDQMNLRFDALEKDKPIFSGDLVSLREDGSVVASEEGVVVHADGKIQVAETKQDRFLRIKAEREAEEKRIKHAIDHPEDCDQSGGW